MTCAAWAFASDSAPDMLPVVSKTNRTSVAAGADVRPSGGRMRKTSTESVSTATTQLA